MKNLFGTLADLVEDLIRDRKLRWMIAIPSAVATIVVVLGLWAQLSDLVNATLACVTVFLALVVGVMAIARRYMRRQIIQKQKVVARYADAIFRAQQSNSDYFTIVQWAEDQDVRKRGDTTIVREITILAGIQAVPAVWARASRSSSQHLSSAVRDKIAVEARYVNDDESDGTRLVSTFDWESEKGIRITVFFDHDLEPGSTARIRLTIQWPRYSADLLTQESTKEYWIFRRSIGELRTTIGYARSFAPNGVKVTALPGTPKPNIKKGGANGTSSVSLLVSDLDPDREYGYHVEIA